MINNHTELLNALAKKYSLNKYLEIGVQNPLNNYSKIICQNKTGVDPEVNDRAIRKMTSDTYFQHINNCFFDLIFIDGLHHADQVKRDFENSLARLTDNGFILIHDCLPENETGTLIPRITRQWWGDVYKFTMNLNYYSGIDFKTFDIDNGCCLVWKDSEAVGDGVWKDYNWTDYKENGKYLMNVNEKPVLLDNI